ncbi:GumC family protein [Leeuwenhoekiella nanhaiensis]|uniref:non-specific protein-tyrosine kinase n=1 Tax=Leeuwenhoekiella nanhaiensis TaxID=1655491 RepID=A0A2G1VNS0_9FLAO|nr:polysaccharide biosynthesis tyrosine autokinase [Leeuwenhoekiella nanhaiensis]PHQ28270.1 tyrosine protein kinase [Leeuwenhoekiella nanhaiensis]
MSQNTLTTSEQSLDLREELNKYLRYWPWFIISVVLLVVLAFTYLRYATTVYSTSSTILIKDDKSGSTELAALEQLGVSGSGGNSIANEIGILSSRRLMENVVRALNLNVQYTAEGSVKDVELYTNSPIKLSVVQLNEEQLEKLSSAARSFQVSREGTTGVVLKPLSGSSVSGSLDSPIDLGFATVVVSYRESEISGSPFDLQVQFLPVAAVANAYRAKLNIALPDKQASLLQLSMQDNVPQKARDVLNQLVVEYNKDAIADENLVAVNTGEFIQERLDIILEDLDDVEGDIENFKEERRLTNIESEAELFLSSAQEFETRQREVGTQLELVNLMLEYLQNSDTTRTLPVNLGIEEGGVNSLIGEYNTLVLERNKVLQGSSEQNPVVMRLEDQIEALRGSINQSLLNLRNNLRVTQNDLDRQAARIDGNIRQVPANERQFRVKARNQSIKEELYLFLLEKREENALKQAINVPKAKVVDPAYGAQVVSPNRRSVLLGAILGGLLIPFGVIYIRRLLNNKIERREDIEKVTRQIPIVGELPRIVRGESDLITENDRSVLAESFRILTTNLQYLLVNAETDGKGYCIYTTSTVKGEGKTFTSINLAVTLANTGKKVVLIGADLRNPQLQRYDSQSKSLLGVSDYLVSNDHTLEKLVHDSKFHPKLKLFLSGSIPPNPSELLRQKKFGQMIAELREQFDYVIVDTAPSMLVADTFLISKYADLILYVTRAGYTEKKLLNFAVDAQNDGKLHDVSFVINDVKTANFGYGNKYGYAYGQEKPSLWERFKKSF